ILHDAIDSRPGDGTLARAGRLRDVLRIDLDEELQWLEAERRLYCLRRFADGAAVLPILMHPDPDPDALASAYAARVVLRRAHADAPLVTLAASQRPENRRMEKLLDLNVVEVNEDELRGFDRLLAVDHQPIGLLRPGGPRIAVLDHHPFQPAARFEYADIRPGLGAASSMLTQYLRAEAAAPPSGNLATALLYGIR